VSGQRCCEVTRQDLAAAHRRVGELERREIVLDTQVADLTTKLAAVTLERDKLLRAQVAATIHNIQETAA
jgi:hypothetical protein